MTLPRGNKDICVSFMHIHTYMCFYVCAFAYVDQSIMCVHLCIYVYVYCKQNLKAFDIDYSIFCLNNNIISWRYMSTSILMPTQYSVIENN